MPLTRYQIRNEYSLADPELYRGADKNDPEALLEGVAMAGLVGVLRQLGDLAEFAAELFHNLHEEVMGTAARSHGLMNRLQQVEADIPLVEKEYLSQTSHSQFLHNTGIDWHPNLQMDQNLITRGDLPRFVMDSYEECRGPPRLFLLDKFDIAGAGACLKRYTDPSFFKAQLTTSETIKTESHREKKARKIKRRASLCRNGEMSEVVPTSNLKLHELFSKENSQIENIVPMHRVKLKRRQSNCSILDSTSEKSYMQRFLGTSSPESKAVYDSFVSPLRLTMESGNSGDLVPEIHEICARSPDNKLGKKDKSPSQSPSRQDKALKQSFNELILDIELEKIPTAYGVKDKKEPVVDGDSKTEASTDGYPSDDVTSEMDSFVDALTTMELAMETDAENRLKNESGLFKIEQKAEDIETNEKQHKLQDQFSDACSIGNSIASDYRNNSFKKERFHLSYSDKTRASTGNVPLEGAVAAKLHPSPETFSAVTVHRYPETVSDDGDVLRPRSLDRVVTCNQASDQTYLSELGEASCNSSPADSTHPFTHLSPAESLRKFQLVGPCFLEVSSGFEEDENSLSTNLHSKTKIFDLPFQPRDDLLPSDLHKSHNKGTEVSSIENVVNGELDLPHSVTLQTNAQIHGLVNQELEACSALTPPDDLPDSITHSKLDVMKPHCVVAEVENVISSSGKKQEYLMSVENHLEPNDFAKHNTVKMIDGVPPAEYFACPKVETSYNNFDRFSTATDCDAPLDPPSGYSECDIQESSSIIEVHPQLADLVSGTNYCVLGHNTFGSPSENNINSENCHGNGDSDQDKLEITGKSIKRHLNGLDAKKEPAVGPTDFNLELCDPQSNKPSASELLDNVNDPLLVERAQDCLNDDFNYPSSLKESDRQLASKDRPKSNLPDSSEETKPSAIDSLPELEAPLEQGLDIKTDQLNVWSLHEEEDIEECSNHIDYDGRAAPSITNHKSERSETTHEHPLDWAPNTQALEYSQPDHSALQAVMEETSPLPPLPPKQLRVGKLQHDSLTSEGEVVQPSSNLFPQLSPATSDQKDQKGFPESEGQHSHPLNEPTTYDENPQQGPKMLDGKLMQPCIDPLLSLPDPETEKIQQDTQTLERKVALSLNPFLPIPATEQQQPQHGSFTSRIEILHPVLNPFQSSQYASLTSEGVLAQPLSSLASPVREDEKPQNISLTLKGQVVQPPDLFTRSTTTDYGKPEQGDLNSDGGMTWQWNSFPVVPSVEDGKPNGVLPKRIPRPKNPLVEEFASRDKIMLRKVEERVLPQLRPKVSERDSLLEQIRTKSFNLKPAVATRPSYKGPSTNLKVVAILEKANAIRQALAGSDDEDEDEDGWSDS